MNINIFNLLEENLDLEKEYETLYELLYEKDFYYEGYRDSLVNLFEERIIKWPYRGTAQTIEDILNKIRLSDFTDKDNAYEDIMKIIQFILNIRLFIEKEYSITLNETMLFQNIDYILQKLNYKSIEEDGKIFLVPKNVEVFNAIENVDVSLGKLLYCYMDYEIKNNHQRKKDILNNIAGIMEPDRDKYNKVNKTLTDNIFHLFNKMNIRHNNISGKDKIEYISNMSEEEIITWYDKTYKLIVYLINQKDNNKLQKEVKELINNIEGNK